MDFIKLQALGNDFIFWGSPSSTLLPSKDIIRFLCDRHYGVGADCAVYISRSEVADYSMHVFNPDGFEAEMCGNALRCSMKYCKEKGFFHKSNVSVETKSGIRSVFDVNGSITAEIGKPIILEKSILNVAGLQLPYRSVNVGNPHCVIFTKEPIGEEFAYIAPAIEKHAHFPNFTNVEFATYLGDNSINMRVWERGIGETLSCVTGSCACVAATAEEFNTSGHYKVHQAGGVVEIDLKECGTALVTGRCSSVFKGTILM